MLSKAASSTNFWVFGMTLPRIENRSPVPVANTLLILGILGADTIYWLSILLMGKSINICRLFVDGRYLQAKFITWSHWACLGYGPAPGPTFGGTNDKYQHLQDIPSKQSNTIKARFDNTQQNSKCRSCDDRGETVNYIISEAAN